MDERRILFHLPGDWLDGDRAGMLPFYRRILAGLADRGVPHDLVPMDRDALPGQVGDGNVHILNHARFPHPAVLSAGVAYIYPFWHLDPQGIRAFSSIRDKPFRPGRIDGEAARAFFNRLRGRTVENRSSRYDQPEAPETVPQGCIAVFLQSEGHRIVGETLWLDRWEMVETCLEEAEGRPVIVKPHPRDLDPDTFDRLEELRHRHANLGISLANIHDILAAAERVVTINSAVGVEAYLHRKPVILCGQADFHHIADEARSVAELRAALRAPVPRRAYAKYIHWYFRENCLNAGAPDLTDRFLDRVGALELPKG
ncbi:MAG: capsular polysaccharide export protein, LipB/KpsS family [Pseudooceanicola sp.]